MIEFLRGILGVWTVAHIWLDWDQVFWGGGWGSGFVFWAMFF